MYNLGEQFQMDYVKALANPKNIIQGQKYRFTILTERLIRLEYSESGLFEDRPSELVWNRDFTEVTFQVKEDDRYLEIKTPYLRLYYQKEKKFSGNRLNPMANLKIELLNTDRIWYYGHPEVRNYGAPGMSFESTKGKLKMKKALYSSDGFVSLDDADNQILSEAGTILERTEGNLDLYVFFYLKDFALCLKDYYYLTGYPALIPRYALGNWWSRNIAYTDHQVLSLMDEFKEHDIPLSVLLLDQDWHQRVLAEKENSTGFTFNKEAFEAPFEFIETLHTRGIRLGLNINPSQGIYPMEEYYEKAKQYFAPDEKGVIPFQIMDPKFLDVYLKMMIHPLDALGVDFFWLDLKDSKKVKELWMLDHYHFYDMMRNYKRRPMILTRNAMLAPHRYPVLYSGKTIVSWDALKRIPLYNSSAANMGVSFWSHDIGGYYKGTEDEELYTRFVQLGVFSPILKFGADKGKYYKREPWKWPMKTYFITRDYLILRHRLIPYLYSEAYKYHRFGMPLVQPIYYRFPEMYDDPIYKNEYFFGSELFVCPIIGKKDHVINRVIHRFYMPEGVWYDFVTGKKFPGGINYVSFFKDEDYPVFAKSGSIIPFGDKENPNDTTPPKEMEIHIFPGRSNQYKLYEDDGVSDLYKKGFYLLSSIEYNYLPNNYTVIIRALEGKSGIVPERRNYKIRFRDTKQANDVIVYVNSNEAKAKSYVDGTDFVVEVKDVPSIGQLTLNCKGKDIEIDAVRLINEDIENIISDLEIETVLKEKIDAIFFSDLTIKKKRIAVRKLKGDGLDKKFIRVFLKLLEYIDQV